MIEIHGVRSNLRHFRQCVERIENDGYVSEANRIYVMALCRTYVRQARRYRRMDRRQSAAWYLNKAGDYRRCLAVLVRLYGTDE